MATTNNEIQIINVAEQVYNKIPQNEKLRTYIKKFTIDLIYTAPEILNSYHTWNRLYSIVKSNVEKTEDPLHWKNEIIRICESNIIN